LIVEVYKTNAYKNGEIKTTLKYTVSAGGIIDLECHFIPTGLLPDLPRLGIAFAINQEFNSFSWYGHGPQENYPDRKDAALTGLWKGMVKDQNERYPRPQETGNKEGIQFLSLTNEQGNGIKIEAQSNTFSASALNYTVSDLFTESHDCNLTPRKEVILSIDCAILGLGNGSCGPGVLKKYTIEQKEHVLRFRMTRAK